MLELCWSLNMIEDIFSDPFKSVLYQEEETTIAGTPWDDNEIWNDNEVWND